MFVVGVDGCRYGWVAVILNLDSGYDVEIFLTFGELWQALSDASQILVDIPIGLKEGGSEERGCDKEARDRLRPHGNSVFPAPRRPTIYFQANNPEYRKVTDFQKGLCGKGLSRQTYAIIPKIRQVDELLLKDGEARKKIREIHPEVCFWALKDQKKPMEFRKKTADGLKERKALLIKFYHDAENLINVGLQKFKRKDVARDDIVDALAAAVTALLGQGGYNTIPKQHETDAYGLPMEMVYVDLEGIGAAQGGGTIS
jgi:predicted RNase H-like nuclease